LTASEDKVTLKDVRQFGRAFWLLSICCVSVYSAVLPFNSVLLTMLQDRDYFPSGSVWRDAQNRTFVYSELTPEPPGTPCASAAGKGLEFCKALVAAQQQAALVMSEPYTMSALLSPVLGMFVDRYGGRVYHLFASQIALMLAHLLMGLTFVPAVLLLLGVGVGYSTFAAVLWPSVPLVVAPSQLGTAYGVLTSLQNLGLCLTPLLVGHVFESTRASTPENPYRGTSIMFACFAGVGVLAVIALFGLKRERELLNRTDAEEDEACPSSPMSPAMRYSPIPPRQAAYGCG
jgi:MFS family permease